MAVDKFKFVSPGVFMEEIDESILEPLPPRQGPMIVGRFPRGPSNRPVRVESFKEFVQVFGEPAPGNAKGDIWRTGAQTAPTYAAYAAQAWLRNNSPCTVVRLLGKHSVNRTAVAGDKSQAGWVTDNTFSDDSMLNAGGAYGLFVMPNPDSYAGGTGATATIVTQGSHATTAGNELTLTNAAGTSLVFTSHADTTNGAADPPTFAQGGDATAGLANLKTAIEASSLASSFSVSTPTGTGPYTLVIAQTALGATGNKAITSNCANWNINGDGVAGDSTFTGGGGPAVTGSLAAIWYVQDGAVVLSGSSRGANALEGAATLIKSTDQKFEAKIIRGDSKTVEKTATFNFDSTSDLYIRKVFNTNPTKTNSQITVSTDLEYYWLGETFDTNVQKDLTVTGSSVTSGGEFLGVILGLDGTTGEAGFDWGDRVQQNIPARTGWFISQDNRGNTTSGFDPTVHTHRLFKFHALDSGESGNKELKISIVEIKAPTDNYNTYGTFTVEVRRGSDNDSKPVVLERFSGVNLNPTSVNFIRKVIGDKQYEFDAATNVLREIGDYANMSSFIRVETTGLVNNGGAEGLLPYGMFGPVVPKTWSLLSGSSVSSLTDGNGLSVSEYVIASGSSPSSNFPSGAFADESRTGLGLGGMVYHGSVAKDNQFTASMAWPTTRLRVSSSEGGLVLGSSAYFGYNSSLFNTRRYDKTNLDLLRGAPKDFNGGDMSGLVSNAAAYQYSWVFTLDDVMRAPGDSTHAIWISGSRATSNSYTAETGSTGVLTAGYKKFTSPMFGGFDGWDVTEKDPIRNRYIDTGTETTNYGYYTVKKAIDMVSDAEFVEYDLLTFPGVTNQSLNNRIINAAEDRADALAIIDLDGNFEPLHETNATETARRGSVTTTVNNLKSMNINSSYGCAFYPFVQIRDLLNDAILYVPPSVVALGTFSSSQRKSAVWFAPAGFTRGGLSEGSSGLPVIGVRQRLTSDDRDKLYDANINPIATFPAEGIVIFGQKTLQVTPSALDRINVRRLLLYLKKEISTISSRLLFEQNVQATWDRFTGKVVPFLENVKSGLGLTDFKVVLDSTTTTPDLVDRNILYAKIFLKPARAIEFIALDFIITRSGASFDD